MCVSLVLATLSLLARPQGAQVIGFELLESGNPSRTMGVPYDEMIRQQRMTGGCDGYLRTERPVGVLYFLIERDRTRMAMRWAPRAYFGQTKTVRADILRDGNSTKELTFLSTIGGSRQFLHATRNPETDVLEGVLTGGQRVRIVTHDRVYLNVVEALISDPSLAGTSKRFLTLCFLGKQVLAPNDESLATFKTATIDSRLLGIRNVVLPGVCHNLDMEYGTPQSRPAGSDAFTGMPLTSMSFESRVLCDRNDVPLCYDLDVWGITATPLADAALPVRAYPTEDVDPGIIQLLREPLTPKP